MITILKGIGFCFSTIVGAKLGILNLMYITVGGIAGYTAYSLVRTFFHALASGIANYTNTANAHVIAFLVLVLPPLCLIPYAGRKIVVRLQLNERISPRINALIGAAYLDTIFVCILTIIGR